MRNRLSLFFITVSTFAVTIPVARVDNNQNGTNAQETVLTPTNVSTAKFGKLGTYAVDGYLFTQCLYIPGIVVSGTARNLVIAATMNNTIYAFNADRPGTAALWSTNFGAGRGSYTNPDAFFYGQSVGIVGTPVVDVANSKVYVVNATATPSYVLQQLSLTTGSVLNSVTITGQVVGTGSPGDPTSGPNLLFNPPVVNERAAVMLNGGKVYVTFSGASGEAGNPPWHGWIFAYSTASLTQVGVFCTTPNGSGGSIWMSGGGPAIDVSGNLYFATGQGTNWDGITNFSSSALKLSPTLAVLDWFAPSNHLMLDANDWDLGSNWVELIPGTTLMVTAGKDYNVYIVDTACMGHVQGSSGCALQTFMTNAIATPTVFSGSYASLFLNNNLFLATTNGPIYGFAFSGSTFNTTPTVGPGTYSFAGAQMAGSSNAGSNTVLWAVTCAASAYKVVQAGTLRALNPVTLAEIWNSNTNARDTLGLMSKFAPPTIANGKVFVPTNSGTIAVFGMIPSSIIVGKSKMTGLSKAR